MKLAKVTAALLIITILVPLQIAASGEGQSVWSAPPSEYVMVDQHAAPGENRNVKARLAALLKNRDHVAAPRLFAQLGQQLYSEGYFSDAIECFQMGWEHYRSSTDHDVKLFADLCGAELSQMYARIGEMEKLQEFLAENQERDFIGQASALIDQSYSALSTMIKQPDIAFKCGPYALQSVLRSRQSGFDRPQAEKIHASKSPRSGFSIEEVGILAGEVGLDYAAYQMHNSAPIITPSVVHWKLNHYAAITEKVGDRYRLKDPTFGSDLLVSEEAIRQESSGYFLLPRGSYAGYTLVDGPTAKGIRGKGYTGEHEKGATSDKDPTACPKPVDTSIRLLSGGMPTYNLHVMQASLRLVDTPGGYVPPYGPSIAYTLKYNQRDSYNPVQYNISSFGHQWSFDWLSYVIYNTSDHNAELATAGGGGIQYSGSDYNTGTGKYSNQSFGTDPLTILNSPSRSATHVMTDGTQHVYSKEVAVDGISVLLMLTKIIDPQGHEVNIVYSGNQIQKIVDAAGNESVFCYDLPGETTCLPLVRSITDPYGRVVKFTYDSSYRLKSITDILSMTSTFFYEGQGTFIWKMTTPYGDTLFEREPYLASDPYDRYIEVTDPEGGKERVESVQMINGTIDHLYDGKWPDNTVTHRTDWNYWRNSFHWGKKAMLEPLAYENATIYHFLHTEVRNKSRLLESVKQPFEGPVVFRYPTRLKTDTTWTGETDNTFEGEVTGDSPKIIGRLLDDGQTQVTKIEYNLLGNPTAIVDPKGRRQEIAYDAVNGWDPISLSAVVNGILKTQASVDYDAKRRPQVFTDAAGSYTTVTYHATWGLPETIKNHLLETVTLDYTTTGLLKKITNPDPYNYIELEYGLYDQVTAVTQYPEAYRLEYEYDVFDRIARVVYPDGTSEKYVYDKLDMIAKRDRLNQWTHYTYDLNRKMITSSNPAGETIQMSWCGCGALEGLIDGEGRVTLYDYDVQGRLISQTLPDTAPTTYEYEPISGRLKTMIDSKGQKRQVSYNIDDTMASRWVDNVAAGTAAVSTVSYTWDTNLRRVTSWSDSFGATSLAYHDFGNNGAGHLSIWNGPLSNDTLTYDYDDLGRVVNSSAGSKTYDSLGNIDTVTNVLATFDYQYFANTTRLSAIAAISQAPTTSFSYYGNTDDRRLQGISYGSGYITDHSYSYDDLGRITAWDETTDNTALSILKEASYDPASRLSQYVQKNASNSPVKKWNWLFDKAGNRQSQQVANSGGVEREFYNVNNRDQITSTTSGGPVHVSGDLDREGIIEGYSQYADTPTDANGGFAAWIESDTLTAATMEARDYSANTLVAGVSIPSVSVPDRDFEYDANGNMTRKHTKSGGVTVENVVYEWDAYDQLVAVANGTHRSEFSYDGLGRRIRIKELESSVVQSDTFFVWDGLTIVAMGPAHGSMPNYNYIWKRYYDQGIDDSSGEKFFYQKDHLGSIRGLLYDGSYDPDYPAAVYNYDAYGNVTESGDYPGYGDFLYTGHYYHRPSGLYLAPYRAYDPEIGRWLSREPLGLDGPNLYHYVFNNPLNGYDPTGLHKQDNRYGLGDDFWAWWHKKKQKDGLTNIASYEEAMARNEEFILAGSPKKRTGFRRAAKILIPLTLLDAYDGYCEGGVNKAAKNYSGVTDAMDLGGWLSDYLDDYFGGKHPYKDRYEHELLK